jgi:hypothetical protein
MGLPVAGQPRDLLVNAWYMGGVNVVDFTKPKAPREVAFYDMAPNGPTGSDNWSAYAYAGPLFRKGRPGIPIYASDGVHNPDTAKGFVVFRADVGRPVSVLDHLNPQTQEEPLGSSSGPRVIGRGSSRGASASAKARAFRGARLDRAARQRAASHLAP